MSDVLIVGSGNDDNNKVVFEEQIQDPDAGAATLNNSRIGSLRPTALMYTSGIGATADLPHMSVMILGLERWQQQYNRMGEPQRIIEPRLLNAVKGQLGASVDELRRAPWVQDEPG
jgi:hypothetical protein